MRMIRWLAVLSQEVDIDLMLYGWQLCWSTPATYRAPCYRKFRSLLLTALTGSKQHLLPWPDLMTRLRGVAKHNFRQGKNTFDVGPILINILRGAIQDGYHKVKEVVLRLSHDCWTTIANSVEFGEPGSEPAQVNVHAICKQWQARIKSWFGPRSLVKPKITPQSIVDRDVCDLTGYTGVLF